jgi:hypothetical protein
VNEKTDKRSRKQYDHGGEKKPVGATPKNIRDENAATPENSESNQSAAGGKQASEKGINRRSERRVNERCNCSNLQKMFTPHHTVSLT